MRTRMLTRTLALAALGIAVAGTSPLVARTPEPSRMPAYGFDRVEGATLAGLKLAFNREMNARADYELFARIARREGHDRVARLFTAIAEAEEIHAARHAANLARLGADAEWARESVVLGTTADNLARSIGIEIEERAAVYRVYGEFARLECDYDALASFNYARDAEGTHAAMFRDALETLKAGARPPTLLASLVPVTLPGPGTSAGPVAVLCRGCGSAYHDRPGRSCPNCGTDCATMRIVP